MTNKLTVVKVNSDSIEFQNGMILTSEHEQDCCEHHYLSFNDLTIEDFEKLEFNLSNDDFFERIDGYGIALKPKHGHPVKIPGYGSNNGYYSSNLELQLVNKDGKIVKQYNISECQEINDY